MHTRCATSVVLRRVVRGRVRAPCMPPPPPPPPKPPPAATGALHCRHTHNNANLLIRRRHRRRIRTAAKCQHPKRVRVLNTRKITIRSSPPPPPQTVYYYCLGKIDLTLVRRGRVTPCNTFDGKPFLRFFIENRLSRAYYMRAFRTKKKFPPPSPPPLFKSNTNPSLMDFPRHIPRRRRRAREFVCRGPGTG